MRVEVNEKKELVCVAEDWKKLTEAEHKFLTACYWDLIWSAFTEDGALKFYQAYSGFNNVRRLKKMLSHAKEFNITVNENVNEYVSAFERKEKAKREQEELEREIEMRKTVWKNRKERGCMHCSYCQQLGDGYFKCLYSGDDLDSRFMEEYNPIIKAMEIFHEVGEPNEHCKYYFGEQINKKEKSNEHEF